LLVIEPLAPAQLSGAPLPGTPRTCGADNEAA
jgi:hypothetical protein